MIMHSQYLYKNKYRRKLERSTKNYQGSKF